MKKFAMLLILLVVVLASSSHADVISVDSRDWIDLDTTEGWSYNYALEATANGGAYSQYKIADEAEVTSLLNYFIGGGWNGEESLQISGNVLADSPTVAFMDMFGALPVINNDYTPYRSYTSWIGYATNDSEHPTTFTRLVYNWKDDETFLYDFITLNSIQNSATGVLPNYSASDTGILLVREVANGGPAPVPEPTTALLFGAGILGIAGIGRTRKK